MTSVMTQPVSADSLEGEWRELLSRHARTRVRAGRGAGGQPRPRDERVRGARPARVRLRRAPSAMQELAGADAPQPERAVADRRPPGEGRAGRCARCAPRTGAAISVCLTRRGRASATRRRDPTHRRVLAGNPLSQDERRRRLRLIGRSGRRGPQRELQRGREALVDARSAMSSSVRRTTITRCDAASSVKPRPAIEQATSQASRPVSRRSIARRTLSASLLTSGPSTRTPSISAIRSRAIVAASANAVKSWPPRRSPARCWGPRRAGREERERPWREPSPMVSAPTIHDGGELFRHPG